MGNLTFTTLMTLRADVNCSNIDFGFYPAVAFSSSNYISPCFIISFRRGETSSLTHHTHFSKAKKGQKVIKTFSPLTSAPLTNINLGQFGQKKGKKSLRTFSPFVISLNNMFRTLSPATNLLFHMVLHQASFTPGKRNIQLISLLLSCFVDLLLQPLSKHWEQKQTERKEF